MCVFSSFLTHTTMFSASFPLLIPPELAGLSAVYLSIKFLTSTRHSPTTANGPSTHNVRQDGSTSLSTETSLRKDEDATLLHSKKDYDGSSIFIFRALRLLAVAALLCLQIFDIVLKTGDVVTCLQLAFLVSVTSLR